jgi:DNA-binding MarR family transcriptional regulator
VKTKTTVQEAIGQTRPFRSAEQECLIALLLTTEAVRNRLAELLARHGRITLQQFNVLRILRGAGDAGLPTLEIVERMIEKTPGITRLIDRLEQKKLVERYRLERDRRQVWCRATSKGSELLRELDAPVDALDEKALGCLARRELAELLDLLNRVRHHQAPG